MPADLVPNATIPELAARIDSREIFRVLKRLQRTKFLRSGPDIDPKTTNLLHRLSDIGLADPGYDGQVRGLPFIWLANSNGDRVLKYIAELPFYAERFESTLRVNSRASTALGTLSEFEQEAILAKAESLQSCAPASWSPEVVPLGLDKRVYLLQIALDLRAFIRVLESGEIELVDIMRADTLNQFLEQVGAGSKVG